MIHTLYIHQNIFYTVQDILLDFSIILATFPASFRDKYVRVLREYSMLYN